MGGIVSSITSLANQGMNIAKQVIAENNRKLQEDKANALKSYLNATVPYNYNRANRRKNVKDGLPYSDSWMLNELKENRIPAGYSYSDLVADGYGPELTDRNNRIIQDQLNNIDGLVKLLKEIKEKGDFTGYPNIVNLMNGVIDFKVTKDNIDEFIEKIDALQNMVGIEINKDKFQEQLESNESDRQAMIDNASTKLLNQENDAMRKYIEKMRKKNINKV